MGRRVDTEREDDRVRSLLGLAPVESATKEPLDQWVAKAGLSGADPPRVLQVPTPLVGLRRRVSSRAVMAVMAVVMVACAVVAVRLMMAQRDAAPVPVGPIDSRGGGSQGVLPSGLISRTSVATASAAGVVIVHVVGRVRTPGVVTLPAGSRVRAAVDAAGGISPGADLQRLNLARVLVDGEQVVVPTVGQPLVPPVGQGAQPGGSSGAGALASGAPTDLNTAGLADLDALPGVGPVLAQRILDWRAEHGRFSSVDELGEVSGIGDKLLAQLRPKVVVR